jgi:hypothetical protein
VPIASVSGTFLVQLFTGNRLAMFLARVRSRFFILVFAVRIDLTLDCANTARLAEFWKLALGYQDEPTPAPFAARQEWLQQVDPGAGADDGAWLCDPEGVGPRLSLLRVPEPKVAKNRLHMDVRVAGATALQPFPGHHVVMADPEGNEFCVS